MSIIELGALGEFLGAIAVVATLAYLAIQVRQSKELLERNQKLAIGQAYQFRAAMTSDNARTQLYNHDSISVQAKVDRGEELTDLEKRVRPGTDTDWSSDWRLQRPRSSYSGSLLGR